MHSTVLSNVGGARLRSQFESGYATKYNTGFFIYFSYTKYISLGILNSCRLTNDEDKFDWGIP